jgi:hypothetical protein
MSISHYPTYQAKKEKILSTIEYLKSQDIKITIAKISKMTGCTVPFLYKCEFLKPYFNKHPKARTIIHSAVQESKQRIDSTEAKYMDLIQSSYFSKPQHIADVVVDIHNRYEQVDSKLLVNCIYSMKDAGTLVKTDDFVFVLDSVL